MPRARRARSAAAVGTLVRVCCCASGTHNQGGPTRFVVTRTSYTMHCECAFLPTRLDLTRVVAGPTSPGGDEGGAFHRGARRGERWRLQVHTGVPVASEPPAARARFGGLLVSEADFRAFPAVKERKLHGTTENRMCAARGDQARRCFGGAGRGRHGEEPRRLDCRPSAERQGAVPPMRPLVRAGPPLDPPECYVGGSTRVPLEHHEYSRSTHEHH
jgi:hypothetical protein